jgi:hypothetical protein
MSLLTKLGLDLSAFSKGWDSAANIAGTGAAGLGKAVQRKLGVNDVFKSFVAAVGIDVKSIANYVAESFGIGEKQQKQWSDFAELSDRVAEANARNMRATLTDEQRYQLDLQDRDRLLKKISETQTDSSEGLLAQKKLELELAGKISSIQEYDAKQAKEEADKRKKEAEEQIDLNEKKHDSIIAKEKPEERVENLKAEVDQIQKLLDAGAFGTESAEKWHQILEKRKGDLIKATDDVAAAQKKADEEAARRAELLEKRRRAAVEVSEKQTDLSNAIGDRGKLSLAELANIPTFSSGVSVDVAGQSSAARQVLDLQKQADDARLSGRAEDAVGLLDQADKIKSGLTSLNSSERADPFESYKKALAASEQTLSDIDKQLAGKFTNQ